MAIEGTQALVLLLSRILLGGVIAFMGMNHFLQTEEMTGYAEHKGLPMAKTSVLVSGAVLIFGGLSIIAGVYPVLAGFVVAAFLLIAALMFHDFWAVPEEQKQDQMTHFLKNIALAGGALAISVLGWEVWEYALDLRLF